MHTHEKKTILLVEDEAIISLSTSKILKNNGYEVFISHKGDKAVSKIKEEPSIDLVLMDINLGNGIDGVEAASKILKIKNLPIIFLTSHSEKHIVDKVKSITSYGYVIKSSGEFVLLESISMALKLFEVNNSLLDDINKREQTELKLKHSEKRLSTVFHASPAGICINNITDGLFVDVNEAFCIMTGYSKDELLGKDPIVLNLWYNNEDSRFTEDLIIKKGKISNVEVRFRKKNGSTGHAMISCEVIELDSLTCILKLVNDISEIKNYSLALTASQTKFKSFFDNVESIVWIKDLEGRFIDINLYTENLLKLKRAEVIGKTVIELFPQYIADLYTENDKLVIDTGKLQVFEENAKINNRDHIFISAKFPLYDSEGTFSSIGAICTDITNIKNIENEKDAFFKAIPDLMFKLNKEGVLLDYKCADSSELYISPEGFLGRNLRDVMPENISNKAISLIKKAASDNTIETFEYSLEINGKIKTYEDRLVPVNNDTILSIVRDITEKKQTEYDLKHREAILSVITDFAERILIGGTNESNMNLVLAELGKIFSLSRTYIFRKEKETDSSICYKQMYEWCDSGIFSSSSVLDTDNFEIDKASELYKKLHLFNKEGYLTGYLEEMESDFEKYIMNVQDLRSYLFIAIFVKGKLWGMIGFDECRYDRKWQDFEVQTLKTAAKIIGGALNKELTEIELANSRELYYKLIDSAPDSVSVTDLNGTLIFSSKKAMELFGYSAQESTDGMSVFGFVSENYRNMAMQKFGNIINTGKPDSETFKLRKKDGSEFTAELTASRYDDAGGNPKGLIIITRDITEKLKTQQQMAEDLVRRKLLIDESGDGIVVLDENGRVFEANKKFAEMLGFSHSEIMSKYVWDWDKNFTKDEIKKMIQNVNESGEHFETIHTRKDGSFINVELSNNGAVVNGKKLVFCVCRDITRRKAIQQKIIENEIKFSKIFNNSPIGISIIRVKDMKYADVNEALIMLSGFSREEFIGKTPFELNFYDKKINEAILAAMKNDKLRGAEFELRRKNGSPLNVIMLREIIELDNEEYYITIINDITEIKKIEKKVRESEEKFSKIFHSSPVGIAITKASTGEFIDVNKALLDITQLKYEDIIGKSTLDFKLFTAGQREELVSTILRNDKKTYTEVDYTGQDGTKYNAAFFMDKFELDGELYILTSVFDITEKITQEIAIKKSLKDKEILLKELQHRVKNNLTVISSLLNLELGNLKDSHTRNIFQNSISRINSLSAIYEQLYATDDISRIDLNIYLSRLINSLDKTYKINENVVLLTSFETGTSIDLKRAVLIGLIFNELLTNSLKYAFPFDKKGTINAGYSINNGLVNLYIKDNGAGLPENFDVNTTESLGLKLVKMLTEQIDGTFKIESSNGTYTEIEFKI